jgi:hypothetical protein
MGGAPCFEAKTLEIDKEPYVLVTAKTTKVKGVIVKNKVRLYCLLLLTSSQSI